MICTNYKEGQKLDVAGLNEITVLIDRSETELTEVAYNQWRKELNGPPHQHGQKEQIFFVVSGEGTVKVGDESFAVRPGCLVYVPAGVTHQTINLADEPLGYLLFNAFSDSDKEGHASFADHIAKVKATRRQQADSQQAGAGAAEKAASGKKGKHVSDISAGKRFDFGSNSTVLVIDRAEAERCEATVVSWPAGSKGALVAHDDKEQTFFVLSGSGHVTVGDQTEVVKQGDVVFVPRNTAHTTEAGAEELTYLCLNTVVAESKYDSFEAMYEQVGPGRIKRWQEGDTTVGS
jgi:mannose-6-phosphate isomerase-like protein (cupin superfamily)